MKNNTKEKDNFLSSIIVILIFFLFLMGVVGGVSQFWMGFHNVDIGYNIEIINSKHDLNLIDMGVDGKLRTGMDSYLLGLNQMRQGFLLFGLSSFLLGFLIPILKFRGEN